MCLYCIVCTVCVHVFLCYYQPKRASEWKWIAKLLNFYTARHCCCHVIMCGKITIIVRAKPCILNTKTKQEGR